MPSGQPNISNQFVQAFQLEEEKAYDYFFRLYFRPLCFFARNLLHHEHDAEDLVQDCFAKLWQKHSIMAHPEAIGSFLYTTVRNACIDVLRRKKVRLQTVAITEDIGDDHPDILFEDALIKTELMAQIYQFIQELPPRISEVCQLYYIAGKNDWEISELLHTSYHTVRNQRQKAICLLRQKLVSP